MSVYEKRLLDGIIDNCKNEETLTYLSCGYKDFNIFGSYGILKIGMWWCLLVDGFKIFTCFFTDFMHDRQAVTSTLTLEPVSGEV